MGSESQNYCCQMAKSRSDEGYKSMKDTLLEHVWSYFAVEGVSYTPSPDDKDNTSEWLATLISATISGCTAMVDSVLEVGGRDLSSDVSTKKNEIINTRLPCKLPIPDTWVHKSMSLAVTSLHLACWRLDFVMIQKLLSLGADPNCLAWEEIQNESRLLTPTEPGAATDLKGLKFDKGIGLCPLHFIGLGLRSPPRNSLGEGTKIGIMHEPILSFEDLIFKSEGANGDKKEDPSLYKSVVNSYPKNSLEGLDRKSELVECCVNILLSFGANPNRGTSCYLNFYFPLDVVIQPSIGIYYGSKLGRTGQNSESIRRQNLEYDLVSITMAARALFLAGAKMSPQILSTHFWKPQRFDCLYSNRPHHMYSLLEMLLHLGVFPTHGQAPHSAPDFQAPGYGKLTPAFPNDGYWSLPEDEAIRMFIIQANNTMIPECLVELILKWWSIDMLHLFMKTGNIIVANSEYHQPHILKLVRLATERQMRSMKHLCKLVVHRAIKFDVRKIESLPLPFALQRELRIIR